MKTLIFDTETTGLLQSKAHPINKQPQIIEFYGAIYGKSEKKPLEELELLIDPGQAIPPIITKITGLKNADVKGKGRFKEHAQRIGKFIQSADIIVAHNLAFDIGMLDVEFARLDVKFDYPKTKICTVDQTIHVKGHRLNLTKLHEYLFDEGFPVAHRAKVDVQALARCYFELKKRGII